MKIPVSWLREWVDVPWPARELGDRLTMAGFELEGLEAAAPGFTGVIVGEILSAERHPQADKLQVCRVADGGGGEPLQVVCGAPNARAGLRTALAVVGAQLPGGLAIKAAKLRGIASGGMLCSAKELGLEESSEGILELPPEAPVGQSLREYLDLDDSILELNVTPNRGDAMSVLGIAREVVALTGAALHPPVIPPAASCHVDTLPVRLAAPRACPGFAGRIIRGVNNRSRSPAWLRERLRRAGQRSISPVVDVTNYVLLELGQPMHAYDLDRVQSGIEVRYGRQDESLELLGGRRVEPDDDVLVIADAEGPVGLAGIMGGARTAVGEDTSDLFLEVAWFAPEAVAGRARRFGLHTDASQRFERGVDPVNQERAMERATSLIVQIAGGAPGPLVVARHEEHLPHRRPVLVRRRQLDRLLGAHLPDAEVERALKGLGMQVAATDAGWSALPPAYRFDIAIEVDLIEEVVRLVGLDRLPEMPACSPQRIRPQPEARPPEASVLETLSARGYQEIASFAFVDPLLQQRLFPDVPAPALANPIASDLAVMRVSLWPGLVKTAIENQRRQQDRLRLFEHGVRFAPAPGGECREIDSLAGLALGSRLPEQWGVDAVSVDFFDVKADVEALLAATGQAESFTFEAGRIPCLHPGRGARILRNGDAVGWLGELHPEIVRTLGLVGAPVLFELDYEAATRAGLPRFCDISRFPQVRRDVSFTLDEAVPLSRVRERVTLLASSLLRDLRVFDIFRGAGVEVGRKSMALGLIFQDKNRTLTDADVDALMGAIRTDLVGTLGAKIRE